MQFFFLEGRASVMLQKISATIYRLRELQKEVFVYSTMWVGDWMLTDCPLFTIHKCASGQRHSLPSPFKYVRPPSFLPAIAKGSMSMEAFHSVSAFWPTYFNLALTAGCSFSDQMSLEIENVLIIFKIYIY